MDKDEDQGRNQSGLVADFPSERTEIIETENRRHRSACATWIASKKYKLLLGAVHMHPESHTSQNGGQTHFSHPQSH